MFRHTSRLQFESKPDKPDPVYAHKLQELIGGAFGEMTVTMQYLFQGWNCRMPGKYKDLTAPRGVLLYSRFSREEFGGYSWV